LIVGPIDFTKEDISDRMKAFEIFRKRYRKFEAMEDNRKILKSKMEHGKALGQELGHKRKL
jgi:hypothetical protein